jgi:hypothetical protein
MPPTATTTHCRHSSGLPQPAERVLPVHPALPAGDLLDLLDQPLLVTSSPARAMRIPRSRVPDLTPTRNRRGAEKPTGTQDSAGETACGVRAGCFLHYSHHRHCCCCCVRDLYYVHYSPVSPLGYEREIAWQYVAIATSPLRAGMLRAGMPCTRKRESSHNFTHWKPCASGTRRTMSIVHVHEVVVPRMSWWPH